MALPDCSTPRPQPPAPSARASAAEAESLEDGAPAGRTAGADHGDTPARFTAATDATTAACPAAPQSRSACGWPEIVAPGVARTVYTAGAWLPTVKLTRNSHTHCGPSLAHARATPPSAERHTAATWGSTRPRREEQLVRSRGTDEACAGLVTEPA